MLLGQIITSTTKEIRLNSKKGKKGSLGKSELRIVGSSHIIFGKSFSPVYATASVTDLLQHWKMLRSYMKQRTHNRRGREGGSNKSGSIICLDQCIWQKITSLSLNPWSSYQHHYCHNMKFRGVIFKSNWLQFLSVSVVLLFWDSSVIFQDGT